MNRNHLNSIPILYSIKSEELFDSKHPSFHIIPIELRKFQFTHPTKPACSFTPIVILLSYQYLINPSIQSLKLFMKELVGKGGKVGWKLLGAFRGNLNYSRALHVTLCFQHITVPKDGDMFKTQFEAIRLYCRAKFKSNPKTRAGVATLGCGVDLWPGSPDSDIEHFLTHTLEHIPWGGEFSILMGLQRSQLGFARFDPEGEDIKRRMLVFVAGPCHGYLTEYILKIGKRLKVNNIALDVVSFPHKDQEFDALKTITLRSFVAAANNKDNNSHFARVPCHSSVQKILVKAATVPLTEGEIRKKMNKKMWERIRRKKNRHSQDLENNSRVLEKHSQDSQDLEEHSENLEEEALSSTCPPVIFPDYLQFRNAGTDKSLTTMNVLIKEKKGVGCSTTAAELSPKIVLKDGETVPKKSCAPGKIQLEDPLENVGVKLVRQAGAKTNDRYSWNTAAAVKAPAFGERKSHYLGDIAILARPRAEFPGITEPTPEVMWPRSFQWPRTMALIFCQGSWNKVVNGCGGTIERCYRSLDGSSGLPTSFSVHHAHIRSI
ncbi:26S proteasome non-ATPase regulatory subunit 4 [Tanacetum coccineum]